MKSIWRIYKSLDKKEILIFILILLYAGFIRFYKLGEIPSVINGDETGSIIHPLQILFHKNQSIFSLTHDYSISYTIYIIKAVAIYLIGVTNTLLASRVITALWGLSALIPFYLLLKDHVNKHVALLTTFAFSSNYWFINFSRLSWINIDCLTPALFLLLFTRVVINKNQLKYYILVSVLSGIVLYNYMGGRIYFLASAIIIFLNLFKDKKSILTKRIKNFSIYLILTFLLFLPQIRVITDNPSLYLLRAGSLNVFKVNSLYYNIDPNNKFEIAEHQINYSIRGLVFLENNIAAESIENQRYLPTGSSAANALVKVLFWMGLIVYIVRKKGDNMWFLVLVFNIIILQIPSVYIPNWSRGIGILPIIYLFAGIGIQETITFLNKCQHSQKYILNFLLVSSILLFSFSDVNKYWLWVQSRQFAAAQQPAINISELDTWLPYQINRIKNNQQPITIYEWRSLLGKQKVKR